MSLTQIPCMLYLKPRGTFRPERPILSAQVEGLGLLEKWWWQRSGSAGQIEEEIRRTRRQIELFNLTIAAIEAELTSRGEVAPW